MDKLVRNPINVFSILKKWFEPDIIYIKEQYNKLPDNNLDYINRFDKKLKGKDSKCQYEEWEKYCNNVFKDDDNGTESN